ncbi:MAG TPA: GLPGLI family protein [Chitinophagaceae bacterium]|nr:GLPGLI family protein [Chitinophagaceae bacterium]
MKYLFLIICFSLFVNDVSAQKDLTITYESGPIAYDSTKPRSGVKKLVLVIRDTISYEYGLHNNEKLNPKKPLGSRFHWHSRYKNYSDRKVIFQSEPFQKPKYCVSDTLKEIQWELMGGEKFILGYSCQKASAIIDSNEVEVFYTTQLQTNAGPFYYWGLPGAILEFWKVGSAYIDRAIEVSLSAEEIMKPDNGKKISRSEFDKILKEIYSNRAIIRTN